MSDEKTPAEEIDISKKFLVDPYMDWAKSEGIPLHLDFGHNLLALETDVWDRWDARGCFAHELQAIDAEIDATRRSPPRIRVLKAVTRKNIK